MIIKICHFCGRKYTRKSKGEQGRKQIYCSHKCSSNARIKNIIKVCNFCGKKYTPKHAGKDGERQKYCSRKCYFDDHQLILKTCDFCGREYIPKNKKNQIYCSCECYHKSCIGTHHTEEVKQIISLALAGEKHPLFGKCGEDSPNWKGGITPLNEAIRTLVIYENWRRQIFERDNFICQKCSDKKGGNFQAHHIKSVSNIIKENNITILREALMCNELWDLNNGITYCEDCHKLLKQRGGLL